MSRRLAYHKAVGASTGYLYQFPCPVDPVLVPCTHAAFVQGHLARMLRQIEKKLRLEAGFATGKLLAPPEYLSLIVTFRCNFRCAMCSIWKKTDFSDELTNEQWVRLVDDLARTCGPRTWVEINGGEPLIRRELVLALVPALKRHFISVALNSNGSLITTQIIADLERAGLDTLKVSFYSLTPETHNALRGTPVAFDRARNAIELIAASNIHLEVGVLVTAKNILDLPLLIEELRTSPNTTVILQSLDEDIESAASKEPGNTRPALWPNPEDVRKFFAWIREHADGVKNGRQHLRVMEQYYLDPRSVLRYRCFVGQRNLVVYPNGQVAFCYKRTMFGDLRHTASSQALSSQAALAERRSIRHCQKYCRVVGCNFSRGIKEYLGDRLVRH